MGREEELEKAFERKAAEGLELGHNLRREITREGEQKER